MDRSEDGSKRPFVGYSRPAEPEAPKEPEVQRREEVDFEFALGSNIKDKLGIDSESISVTAPKYTVLEKAGLKVGWALIGDDYYYQIELMRKTNMDDKTVMGAIVAAFATVVPSSIQVYIQPPPEKLEWPLWTVVVQKARTLIGAKDFMEQKLVDNVLKLRFW